MNKDIPILFMTSTMRLDGEPSAFIWACATITLTLNTTTLVKHHIIPWSSGFVFNSHMSCLNHGFYFETAASQWIARIQHLPIVNKNDYQKSDYTQKKVLLKVLL
jgi:hypothetical protein